MQKFSNKHFFNYLKEYLNTTITVDVVVLNRIYYNENGDNVFGVYEVAIEDEYIDSTKIFSVVGNVDLIVDKTYQVTGEVIYDEKYGFEITKPSVISIFPKRKETIKRLLANLHGIGPARAVLIVNEFGDKSLDVLLNNPEKIKEEVRGIGTKTLEKASKHLKKEQERFRAIESLSNAGLSTKIANSLLSNKEWKKTYETILQNPYKLIESGTLTFKKTDEIASQLGILPSNENRLKSGIIYALKLDATNNGNCYCEKNLLLEYASEILTVFLPNELEKYITFKNGNVIAKYFSITKEFKTEVFEKYKNVLPLKKNTITGQPYSRTVFKMYQPSTNELLKILEIMEKEKIIYVKNDVVTLNIYEEAENTVANIISRLDSCKEKKYTIEEAQKVLDKIIQKENITLSEDQNKAIVNMAISDGGMHLLLGSAGCGKTFSLNLFIKLYKELRHISSLDNEDVVTILAPTGRASKVASAATHIRASTIHRACGIKAGDNGNNYHTENMLMTPIIIIDETSMLDVRLTAAFMNCITLTSKVIFVGDIKQLPPIGAGRVLYDIIDSKCVETFMLSTIQRQKENSGIITNAVNIVNCQPLDDKKDCRAIEITNDNQMSQVIFKDFYDSLKTHSIEDVQIIAPMWQYENGVHYLNYEIQKIYNPIISSDEKKKLVTTFKYKNAITPLYLHKGDKVINTKNSTCTFYKRVRTMDGVEYVPSDNVDLANGEIGIVTGIKNVFSDELFMKIEVVIVKFDDGYVFFYEKNTESYGLLSNLNLAYAITIHKSQGSQWKHVIIAIAKKHSLMVSNNLLYTALTRASESATIVYDKQTLEQGEQVIANINRKTQLKEKIKENSN